VLGVTGLQRPASYVEGDIGHWGREGHKKGEKIKSAIVLAVGWKCRKHWSNNGIPGPALQQFVVLVETRELPNLCACSRL